MKRKVFLFLALSLCLIQAAFAQQDMQANASPQAAPRAYLLAPGDVIEVKVLGEPDFNFEKQVDENGNIDVPFFDTPLVAMCKNERDVKTQLMQMLSKYLVSPQVTFTVKDRKSRVPVTIYGEVKNTQPVVLMREARLLEIISTSGGVTEDAGGLVQISRTRAPICGSEKEIAQWMAESDNGKDVSTRMYSLSSIKMGGEGNPVVYPGDIILVHKAAPVYFTGEVRSATGLRIPEGGLSLYQAVAMVGGVNSQAKTKDIKIYRLKDNSKDREIISVNYDLIRKGEQKDVMLQPYDVVEVDKAKDSIGDILLKAISGGGINGLSTVMTGGVSRILY